MSRQTARPTLPRHSAFTLVELLVVIGIIAVLISILLPTLGRARSQAQAVQCMSNMRQWGVAFTMYTSANKGAIPNDGPDAPVWNDPSMWFNNLPPYLKQKGYDELHRTTTWSNATSTWTGGGGRIPRGGDASIFVCPSTNSVTPTPSTTDVINSDGSAFLVTGSVITGATATQFGIEPAPSGIPVQRPMLISYVPNSKINRGSTITTNLPWGGASISMRMNNLRPSSNVVYMVEIRHANGEIPKGVEAHYAQFDNRQSGRRLSTRDVARVKADWQRFTARHRNGGNLLFADGHVEWAGMKEVLTATSTTPELDMNQPGRRIWSPLGRTGN